jgi:hypothetical protein
MWKLVAKTNIFPLPAMQVWDKLGIFGVIWDDMCKTWDGQALIWDFLMVS